MTTLNKTVNNILLHYADRHLPYDVYRDLKHAQDMAIDEAIETEIDVWVEEKEKFA